MELTIEDLRNDALYQIWEFSGAFDIVIANNGPDSDIELWSKARECALEIGKSVFLDKDAENNKDTSFYPSEKFRRFCSEVEFDKKYDHSWAMTFKSVLYTMVYPLGISIEDVSEEDEIEMEEREHKIMFDSIKYSKSALLGLTKDGKIYRKMLQVLKKWSMLSCEQNPYLRVHEEDDKYTALDLPVQEKANESELKTKEIKVGKNKQMDIKASFQIISQLDHVNNRLGLFYKSLKSKGYIDHQTDQLLFIDMFKGITPTHKIVWTKKLYELHYLFNKLNKMKTIGTKPKPIRLWQTVCACFKIRKRNYNGGNNPNEYRLEDNELTPNQFNKGGKLPDSHEELDNIIAFLDPKLDYSTAFESQNDIKGEITGMFSNLEVPTED